MSEHRFHDDGDKVTCGECGREWCGICTPTPASRCPFEYDHEDEEEGSDVFDTFQEIDTDGLMVLHITHSSGLQGQAWLEDGVLHFQHVDMDES